MISSHGRRHVNAVRNAKGAHIMNVVRNANGAHNVNVVRTRVRGGNRFPPPPLWVLSHTRQILGFENPPCPRSHVRGKEGLRQWLWHYILERVLWQRPVAFYQYNRRYFGTTSVEKLSRGWCHTFTKQRQWRQMKTQRVMWRAGMRFWR